MSVSAKKVIYVSKNCLLRRSLASKAEAVIGINIYLVIQLKLG
jgi:hypothetical protein